MELVDPGSALSTKGALAGGACLGDHYSGSKFNAVGLLQSKMEKGLTKAYAPVVQVLQSICPAPSCGASVVSVRPFNQNQKN